ncbi:MAG TPA: PAS domain-containing protein [Methylomusa anaerophila]|uniref:histidine kinase n=1 Tax=Methylomusa anaerophila TaxID=1930071 RepID=A0A348AII6_9FIRM|nr:PAS domain-containing protein [Methylomusa anaerophila]BBB90884.1 sporulation kinase E [Methylomusa anaerophila]HML90603.1 PAS domain-containing protein [Methylomusa anaerophila]
MPLQELIKSLAATDQQLEKVLANRLKFQPQFKFKFDFVSIMNKDLKYFYISEMGARYFGLKPADMIGRDWKKFINLPSEAFERLDEKIIQVFNTGTADYENCIDILNIQGQYDYFECLISPIVTSSGEIEAVMCNVTDITERKLSELTLSNQVAKFSQLLDLCPMAIYIVDNHGKIVSVNKAFTEDISSNRVDLIGKQYKLINEYLGIDHEKSAITKALNGIETSQEFLTASEKKYLMSVLPVREQATGAIVGAIGINSNITEHEKFREENQKKQHELLNQYLTENKKLNQLIELCPLGIVLYDNKGNVIAVNKAYWERISNFKEEEFLGRSGQYLLETLGFNWENSPCQQALNGVESLDCYLKNAYGNCYLINAIPLRNYKNTIIGAMTIIHDITEYEKLKEDMVKLDRLNLVAEMAAGVAHEIRNPMTVIKGYLQFLNKKVPDDMVEQFCIVLGELERIEQIITNFLSLARNKLVEYKEQDLNAIIKGIIPLISTDAMEQGIELKINLAEELPHLLLNEKEIKQLLLNLTRNGIEAMSQHGTLTIETIVEGNTVSLCVDDCGCGICKENREKIFDPFFTTKENGTGLGLSVCAGIVRRHNGIIEVESKKDKGTRFIITFNAKTE